MPKLKYKLTFFVIFLSIALSIIFLHKLAWFNAVENTFFKITHPVSALFYKINYSFSNFSTAISSIKDVKKQNAQLLEENNALKTKNAELKEELLNFQSLAQIDQFEKEQKLKTLPADITGSGYKTLLINKGQKDGVIEGLAVVTAQGFLAGRVEEALHDYSKILLITDQNSIINVQFQESRTLALLEGNYHLGALINNLPASEKIQSNENIITSGRDQNIPQGILIGKSAEIHNSPDSIFQEVKVDLAADFNKLEKLFVVLP